MTFERLNPTMGEVGRPRGMTVAEAIAEAERADAAFLAWTATGPNARRALLAKAAAMGVGDPRRQNSAGRSRGSSIGGANRVPGWRCRVEW